MKTLSPRPHLPSPSLAGSFKRLDLLQALRRLGRLILLWQSRVHDRAHLAQLDPHLRRDLGLTDAQIAEEVRKPFWIA